jgi:AraC family cel operon transcriptional repressor
MEISRLQFSPHVSGCNYTAALYTHDARIGRVTPLHNHDFYEMMYVVEGEGVHEINGREEPMRQGDLFFIRPDDTHAIHKRARRGVLAYVNVEFPIDVWISFAAGAGPVDGPLESFPRRRNVSVGTDDRDECARVFQRVLNRYFQSPRRLDLYRFLSAALGYLDPVPSEEEEALSRMPVWLAQACRGMNDQSNLQAGLDRMTELSNVSFSHLARTLKTHTGQTPTEFINTLRLRNASILLTTTSREICDIALDCGFENLSYFYRLFRREYGRTPHRYRIETRRQTVL